jgi:serine phosphatase RsbU (regulator of sigma subunit)
MPETNFRAAARFHEFWTLLKSSNFKSVPTLYFLGWLITLFIILLFENSIFTAVGLIHVLYLWCWYKLATAIDQKYRPQAEFLILMFFAIFLLDASLLRSLPAIPAPALVFFSGLQALLLAALTLIFGLVLIHNTQTNFWFYLLAFFLAMILLNLVDNEGAIYRVIVQLILLVFLLRRTAWLELLTKTECWLYLFLLLAAFFTFSKIEPFAAAPVSARNTSMLWFGLPMIFYFSFKMYLLALLLKIPVVLVYNFASLSRKLKISSLFQATVPQFIQLCMLLLVIFFFLAGWQAEKLRLALDTKFDEMVSGKNAAPVAVFQFPLNSDRGVQLKGYQPLRQTSKLPDQGVLALARLPAPADTNAVVDYFVFFKSHDDSNRRVLNLVKLDTLFLSAVSEEVAIFAASQLTAYPYQPSRWESYIYDFSFLKSDRQLWIFPFALLPLKPAWSVSWPLTNGNASSPAWVRTIDRELLRRAPITVGRVAAPLVDASSRAAGFFAFDIILLPQLSAFTPTLIGYIVLLALVYMLVNAVVVGRMVKFGEEINHMIVQKFNQLKTGIREISAGNLDYKVRVEGRDEFVELAERFNVMGEKLQEAMAKEREKERLEHELAIARQVQLALLPRTLPDIPGFQVAAALQTANEVGGDFYDLRPLDKQNFLFTIGDVSGKGASAAFYMAQCISLLRFSPQFSRDPLEIVVRLNQYFSDPLIDRQVFVTAVVGSLDAKTARVQLVRAGHTPPILIPGNSAKSIAELQCQGLGIGIERSGGLFEKNLKLLSLKLQPGDTLLFYTDGLVEAASLPARGLRQAGAAENAAAAFYSEERLLSVLQKSRGVNAEELLQILKDDIAQFYAGRPLVDDYTVLIIQKRQ